MVNTEARIVDLSPFEKHEQLIGNIEWLLLKPAMTSHSCLNAFFQFLTMSWWNEVPF